MMHAASCAGLLRIQMRRAALRSLLKEIRLLLDPEDDEDDEELIEDAEEKEIVLALRTIVLELKAMRR